MAKRRGIWDLVPRGENHCDGGTLNLLLHGYSQWTNPLKAWSSEGVGSLDTGSS